MLQFQSRPDTNLQLILYSAHYDANSANLIRYCPTYSTFKVQASNAAYAEQENYHFGDMTVCRHVAVCRELDALTPSGPPARKSGLLTPEKPRCSGWLVLACNTDCDAKSMK